MKAIVFRYLFVALAAVLFLIIALGIYDVSNKMFEDKSLELLRKFKTYKPYVFNINDFIVDPNDPNAADATQQNDYYTSGSDPAFCKNVRNCIEMRLVKGEDCVITYKVKPGTPFNINSFKNALAACPSTTIKEEMYGNTQRKICEFKPITNYNELREDNLSLAKYEPYIHNCYLPDNLGSLNVLNDVDSINYLYSGRGTKDGYSFENGGIVRILVTNVSLKKDFATTCSYSLYVCGQNSIGTKVDETTVQVLKKVQNLDERELYYNETVFWGGPRPSSVLDLGWYFLFAFRLLFGGLPEPPKPYNIYGYYPRYYEFDFKSLVPNAEMALVDAIDAGTWEWNRININNKNAVDNFMSEFDNKPNIHFSYYPIESSQISEDNSLSFSTGCWKDNYEKVSSNDELTQRLGINVGDITFTDSESLKNTFTFNRFGMSTKLRMVLGVKKIFINDKKVTVTIDLIPGIWSISESKSIVQAINEKYGLNMDPETILVMDPVTFCSS